MKSFLIKALILFGTFHFGRTNFSDFLASKEAKEPKEISVDEIENSKLSDLPRYFILKDAVIPNFAAIESVLELKKSKAELSTTTIFPVYTIDDSERQHFRPGMFPVTVFLTEPKAKSEIISITDTTLFKKPISVKVKNEGESLNVEELNLFKQQSINTRNSTIKLKVGYDEPTSWSLLYSIILFVICLGTGISLVNSIRKLFNKTTEEEEFH